MSPPRYLNRSALIIALILAATHRVAAQSATTAVFVANNGNLEGSVSSFTLDPYTGQLAFVNKIVTGTRANINDPCGGCNASEISLSPSGRYLATCHPAGVTDGITVFQVASNAVISQVAHLDLTPGQDGPLDIEWVDDTYLGTVMTAPSPNKLAIFRFTPSPPSLVQVDSQNAGSFASTLAVHPTLRVLYASDTSGHQVFSYSVAANGLLSLIDTDPLGSYYDIGPGLTPDGTKMYGGGGISGNVVYGHNVAADGTLSAMSGTPFSSPGSSPKLAVAGDDSKILAVGHGTDATIRTFFIDQATGALTYTNNFFDVGLQGTLGGARIACFNLFVTDNSTATDGVIGIYSFTLKSDGTLSQNQPIQSTTGTAPTGIATWIPGYAKGDMNCDCRVDLSDVDPYCQALLDAPSYSSSFAYCDINNADMNGDTFIDGGDVQNFVDAVIP